MPFDRNQLTMACKIFGPVCHLVNYVNDTRTHIHIIIHFTHKWVIMMERVSGTLVYIPTVRPTSIKMTELQRVSDSLGGIKLTMFSHRKQLHNGVV